ncbi:MAG: hypothetical protein LYZ66_03940 [Nitrososphaerales archaeon]|nr:hypothetical protein [Nitrososphaerales archaeon]
MVELVVMDETGHAVVSLRWKRRSRELCCRFKDSKIARASFKVLAREFGREEDTWQNLGI